MARSYLPDPDAAFSRLIVAIEDGNLTATRAALDAGADAQLNEYTEQGLPPLHLAAAGMHLDIMELLLKRGAEFTERSKWGETIFDTLLTVNTSADFLKKAMTLAGEIDFDQLRNGQQHTALHTAARRLLASLCEVLLEAGHAPNPGDHLNWRPLHVLASDAPNREGAVQETMNALLRHGADISARTKSGRTPFMQVCAHGSAEIIGAFLDAAPHLADERGAAVTMIIAFDNPQALPTILERTGVTKDELAAFIDEAKAEDSTQVETLLRRHQAHLTLEEKVARAPGGPKGRM